MTFPRSAILILLLTSPATLVRAADRSGIEPLQKVEDHARALLRLMSLPEKIGQMTEADQAYLDDDSEVESYGLGSVLSGGDSDPATNSPEDWRAMCD